MLVSHSVTSLIFAPGRQQTSLDRLSGLQTAGSDLLRSGSPITNTHIFFFMRKCGLFFFLSLLNLISLLWVYGSFLPRKDFEFYCLAPEELDETGLVVFFFSFLGMTWCHWSISKDSFSLLVIVPYSVQFGCSLFLLVSHSAVWFSEWLDLRANFWFFFQSLNFFLNRFS